MYNIFSIPLKRPPLWKETGVWGRSMVGYVLGVTLAETQVQHHASSRFLNLLGEKYHLLKKMRKTAILNIFFLKSRLIYPPIFLLRYILVIGLIICKIPLL